MRSLAKYFYEIIKKDFDTWSVTHKGKGIPGRLILKEFDANLVKEILAHIQQSGDFPLASLGSATGFIVVVEEHDQYRRVDFAKSPFSSLAHERNREGNYFCLMFIAEVKPTLAQVSGLDQSAVFELTELTRWVELSKQNQPDNTAFSEKNVEELARFVSELTNSHWNARPFIEIDKINAFIDGVIQETIRNGLFYEALGKSCVHLGGINRLGEFQSLKGAGIAYRRTFRSLVTKTLFRDIDFWRAIDKNKEVSFDEIESNIKRIKESGDSFDDFCLAAERYFKAYFAEERDNTKCYKKVLQQDYDSSFPYPSVLQAKSTKPKFYLGKETSSFLSDNDTSLSEDFLELLELVDIPSQKPEINELRKFYFTYSKDIAENTRLDKAWLKEITNSKTSECSNLVEGLLDVLSKSLLLNDVGEDNIVLSLAKDRTRRSLERKNWEALNYFNREYRDLADFWSQFGSNFSLDFGQVFDENFASTVEKKTNSASKSANELHFRVVRKANNEASPTDSWELKWSFNPYGFESVKYTDFIKLPDRKGFFHNHSMSLDPLVIKSSESTPTIANTHMFLAPSGNMKKGLVVKKGDRESSVFSDHLHQLKTHDHLTDEEFSKVEGLLDDFVNDWKASIQVLEKNPLTGQVSELERSLEQLLHYIRSLRISRETASKLVYEVISAHTFNVIEFNDYCVYLPWSPYSLLMQSNKNKILKRLALQYQNKTLSVANKSDGVLGKLFRDLLESYGKSLFLKTGRDGSYVDLVSTASHSGYYEFGRLDVSKNAIHDAEIKSVVNATASKFLETYPNERHHLQVLCAGLLSYEHLLAVYDELLKIADNHDEQLTLSLIFSCSERSVLDAVYQTICESFDSSRVDPNITIKIVNDINEIEDGEIDLIYSFDPLYTHNRIATETPRYIEKEFFDVNWEYCASRKVPSDPITRKTQFSMNNHVHDSTGRLFHSAFKRIHQLDEGTSFCREVSQDGLKEEISKGLNKCNWLVIYDFLLSKETLNACSEYGASDSSHNRRVLRYIQGEGSKRSLAIITDKETHYITQNLNSDIRKWQLIHPDSVPSLVDRIFTLSNSFSSDTLLRSVGNGNFSHDLVGTAGAALLLERLFENESKVSPIFWVHLDDYLSWFKSSIEDDAFKSIGRTVNYISDLLGIYISKGPDSKISINLIISESKLTSGNGDQLIKSCKQVKSTVELVASMLRSSKDIDFSYWLNKFYEFILGHFKFRPNIFEFEELISLKQDEIYINVCGISVVFHYDNQHVETSAEQAYNTDHLCVLNLSTDDTRSVFENMLDDQCKIKLFDEFQFGQLELNRKTIEPSEDIATDFTEPEESNLHNSVSVVEPADSSENASDTIETIDTHEINAKTVGSQADRKNAFDLIRNCIDFLETRISEHKKTEIDVASIKSSIREIFRYAGLPSNFSDVLVTPNSIVVKLKGEVNLNPSKILKLKDNFLSVVGLSLRRVYPDPGVMVMVFDRDERETVHFGRLLNRTLVLRRRTLEDNYNNRIMLGQDEFSDDCVFFRLDGASPHALIGGQTKSGKSILMNNMIIDLLMSNSPENLHLRLFDPKQVEFAAYSSAPHLAHPVVLEKEDAILRLQELEELMNDRYKLLMKLGLRDFESHNRKYPEKRMAREVVFFDELADWILDSEFKEEAKDIIVRLSSKGRAAGIHLVLATQRPSADVVIPLLRANLDTKVALKVDRDQNSEIILGESGAENLLGYGHGIVKTEGETHSIQVGFTDIQVFDELIEFVIGYWVERQSPPSC